MSSAKTILVTGGAGFIGCNFIHMLRRQRPGWQVVCLDALTYAGNMANLQSCSDDTSFRFVKGDICNGELMAELMGGGIDVVVNFAAESHVDRSIIGCGEFVRTNIVGTQVLLDAARKAKAGRFIQISTDEVYGSLGPEGFFTETTPLAPNSPYSASKASADMLVRSYYETYGMETITTRCSNNYGPYQFPEKLIPLAITNALEDKPIPVYGDGLNVRDWIFVTDHCEALDVIVEKGKPGEIYNIAGDSEKNNLEVIHQLLDLLGKPESLIQFVADRPGHDRRYALDTTRINGELGWKPANSVEEALVATVEWYVENESWWRRIKSGEYATYYERMYLNR